jgi:hypothetical protein
MKQKRTERPGPPKEPPDAQETTKAASSNSVGPELESVTRYKINTFKVSVTPDRRLYDSEIGLLAPICVLHSVFRKLDAGQEHFVLLALDSPNRVIGYKVICSGTMNCAHVDNRLVFRAAFVLGAASIIVSHNHPGAVSRPSEGDLHYTYKLRQQAEILDVPLMDHIILNQDLAYTSLRQSHSELWIDKPKLEEDELPESRPYSNAYRAIHKGKRLAATRVDHAKGRWLVWVQQVDEGMSNKDPETVVEVYFSMTLPKGPKWNTIGWGFPDDWGAWTIDGGNRNPKVDLLKAFRSGEVKSRKRAA